MADKYPRRFYRQKPDGSKQLKVSEKEIKSCKYCGTHFIIQDYKRECSKYCFDWMVFWGWEEETK